MQEDFLSRAGIAINLNPDSIKHFSRDESLSLSAKIIIMVAGLWQISDPSKRCSEAELIQSVIDGFDASVGIMRTALKQTTDAAEAFKFN